MLVYVSTERDFSEGDNLVVPPTGADLNLKDSHPDLYFGGDKLLIGNVYPLRYSNKKPPYDNYYVDRTCLCSLGWGDVKDGTYSFDFSNFSTPKSASDEMTVTIVVYDNIKEWYNVCIDKEVASSQNGVTAITGSYYNNNDKNVLSLYSFFSTELPISTSNSSFVTLSVQLLNST